MSEPTYTGPTLSLHVKITIDPSNLAEFFALCRPVYEAVIAEPECIFFEVFQNPAKPGELKWIEHWKQSIHWLQNVQLKRDYYKSYFEQTEPMFIQPREIEIWERMPGNEWVTVKKEVTDKA